LVEVPENTGDFEMKPVVSFVLAIVCLLSLATIPSQVCAGSDDFQNLEFFLDRSLKNANNSTERNEIINRFLFKALALVYQQNKEQIRLRRESLSVLKQLRELEVKRARELERYLSRR
jgi:hypothetical protein